MSAHQDALTGLPNRPAIHEILAREVAVARENGWTLGLLFIDLDGFKAVNDRHSHRIGDLLLCELARRLKSCACEGEFVARLGGDEFLMVVAACPEGITQESLRERAVQIVALLTVPATIEGIVCGVGASMGTAFFPDDAEDEEHMIRAADHAMYEAKRAGTNQIRSAPRLRELTLDGHGLL